MQKILDWIKNHRIIFWLGLLLIVISPLVIIHILFSISAPHPWLVAQWSTGDALAYCASVLSFLSSVALGLVTVIQTDKANKLSAELADKSYKLQVENEKRIQWANAKDFFDRFDSFEARSSRAKVYKGLNGICREDIVKTIKKCKHSNLEGNVTYTISMYDAYIRMINMDLLPKDMLEGSALWTAVNFYVLVEPYITYRRNEDNPYYAVYLVEYFQNPEIQKKVNTLANATNIPNPSAAKKLFSNYKEIVKSHKSK